MSTPEKFSDHLKKVRHKLGLTQEQMAVAMDYTRSYISQIEAGLKDPGDRFVRDLDRLERGESHSSAHRLSALSNARKKAGLSPVQAAKKLGIDVGVYQAIEGGHGKASERLIEKICEIFPELDKADLIDGSDSANRVLKGPAAYGAAGQKADILTPPDVTARYVPLISWAQAGTMASFTDEAYQYEAHLAFNVTDRRAIAVKIRGDSMAPQYSEGDIAVIYPSCEARNGDLVIARLDVARGDDVMFKIFSATRGGDAVLLSSYNPAYPPLHFNRRDFAWIYPVASVVKNLRK